MKSFDYYFFDFDGTLVDSYDSLEYVFEEAYSLVGISVPKGFTLRLMRVPLSVGYKELHAPETEEAYKIFGEAIIRLLDDPHALKLTKIYSDTIETLNTLKQTGKKLGIVTSNNQKHVREVLRYLGIDENIFELIVGNKEVKKHKPNPDPIYKGMEILGLSDKSKICYVGDGLDDMRCAINAGVTPILIDRRNEYTNECENLIEGLKELL